MRRTTIPVEELLAWGKLNGVDFNQVEVKADMISNEQTVKGAGLVSTSSSSETEDGAVLISVPQDLILAQEQVKHYAVMDKHLKSILDAADAFGRTARGAILIFLLFQITNSSPDYNGPRAIANPHTDYVKLLPKSVLLPTFYTDEEKNLLFGTSLHEALDQKLRSLENEFSQLRELTQEIPWCQKYWWDDDEGILTFEDWLLVDALYRSRALDLPGAGHAMVPCVDMANHVSGTETIALYETDGDGRAVLQKRPGKTLAKGEEITITYGDDKGACEMIFSYGFLELGMSSAEVIFLNLDIPGDDPLRMAKKAANKAAPGVRLFVDSDGKASWESDYVWWACVNEEDGLEFRVAQENDGTRQLETLWKNQRIDPSKLSKALMDDPRWDVFRLRAIVVLQECVTLQASHLEAGNEVFADVQSQTDVRGAVWALIEQLRDLEGRLLSMSDRLFEEQKAELLTSNTVKEYLEAAQSSADPGIPAQTSEDDFA